MRLDIIYVSMYPLVKDESSNVRACVCACACACVRACGCVCGSSTVARVGVCVCAYARAIVFSCAYAGVTETKLEEKLPKL